MTKATKSLTEKDFLEGDGVAVFVKESKDAKELLSLLKCHGFDGLEGIMLAFYKLDRLPARALKAFVKVKAGAMEPADLKAELHRRTKDAEVVRASLTRPLNFARDRVIALFKDRADDVGNVDKSVDVLVFRRKREREAAEEATRAEESTDLVEETDDLAERARTANDPKEREKAAAQVVSNERRIEALQKPAKMSPVETQGGAKVHTRRGPLSYKLTDKSKVPLDYLVLDGVAIRKALNADKNLVIPGLVRAYGPDRVVVGRNPKGV